MLQAEGQGTAARKSMTFPGTLRSSMRLQCRVHGMVDRGGKTRIRI